MTQMSGSISLDGRRFLEVVRQAVRDELAYPVLLTPEDTQAVLWDKATAGTLSPEAAGQLAERLKANGYAITAVRTDLRDWYAERYQRAAEVDQTITAYNQPEVHTEGEATSRHAEATL